MSVGGRRCETRTDLIQARFLVRGFTQWDDETMPDKEEVGFEFEPDSTRDECRHDAGENPTRRGCIATGEERQLLPQPSMEGLFGVGGWE